MLNSSPPPKKKHTVMQMESLVGRRDSVSRSHLKACYNKKEEKQKARSDQNHTIHTVKHSAEKYLRDYSPPIKN